MKKYIAPYAKAINIQSESLMAMSGLKEEEGQNYQFSNGRQTASESIWGSEE